VDLARYLAFLESDHGGAWEREEITVFRSPSLRKVEATIGARSDIDFSLVVFAGHGHHDGDETSVWVNDHESCSVSALNTFARRQMIIVDACRTPLRGELFEKRADFGGEVGWPPDFEYRASCRALYDEAIRGAEMGQSIAYASSPGEAAGDTSRGGRFSRSLLDVSEQWSRSAERGGRATLVLDVPSAVSHVQQIFRRNRYPQTPQLENGRRFHSFPIAVA
jgi:hypothetical protein